MPPELAASPGGFCTVVETGRAKGVGLEYSTRRMTPSGRRTGPLALPHGLGRTDGPRRPPYGHGAGCGGAGPLCGQVAAQRARAVPPRGGAGPPAAIGPGGRPAAAPWPTLEAAGARGPAPSRRSLR